MDYEKLSKEISYALRHSPWEYELELDIEGWVDINQLIKSLHKDDCLNKLNDKLKITKEETISSFENKLTRNNQVSKPNILYGTELIITQRGPVAPCFTS